MRAYLLLIIVVLIPHLANATPNCSIYLNNAIFFTDGSHKIYNNSNKELYNLGKLDWEECYNKAIAFSKLFKEKQNIIQTRAGGYKRNATRFFYVTWYFNAPFPIPNSWGRVTRFTDQNINIPAKDDQRYFEGHSRWN